jgi:rsbT antagonist protein RsbS
VSDRLSILRIGEILPVSIQADLDDQTLPTLQEDLAGHVVKYGARGVIIEITVTEIVDSFMGRMLSTIASVSRLSD